MHLGFMFFGRCDVPKDNLSVESLLNKQGKLMWRHVNSQLIKKKI